MMPRTLSILALAAALFLWTGTPVLAADSCSLDGVYAGSLALSDGQQFYQSAFQLAFVPSGDCAAIGTVTFTYRTEPPTGTSPVLVESWSYLVNPVDLTVEIGSFAAGGIFQGQIAQVVGGVAQGLTLVAHPGLEGYAISGTALRQGPNPE